MKAYKLFTYGIITIVSFWVTVQRLIKKKPLLQQDNEKPILELASIILIILIMYIGLSYRWIFCIGMLLNVGIQKSLLKKIHLNFLASGVILSIFPLLPVVGPQPRLFIV